MINPKWIPMRWPSAWRDASVLQGTGINWVLLDESVGAGGVAARLKESGTAVGDTKSLPAGVTLASGSWPGTKLSREGDRDTASAGPTGIPWVDSNGWLVRLTGTLHPSSEIWVDTKQTTPGLPGGSYLKAVADAAAYGGRWIITLDDELAAAIAAQKPAALDTWREITRAAQFFQEHGEWTGYIPRAVAGIISDFSGGNEFLSQELLNLLARTNEQYRIVLKNEASRTSLAGLKAVIYADQEPPSEKLRAEILAFVREGGMLITGPKWGAIASEPSKSYPHPRFQLGTVGQGRIAVAQGDLDDAYTLANDSVILISHRHDLVRFWNGGAFAAYLTDAPDRKSTLLQMLFYAMELNGKVSLNSPTSATVRVVGKYRSARLFTLDGRPPRAVEMEMEKDSMELHLPSVANYAAVVLEA